MLAKFSIALLIAAAPAVAQDAPPADSAEAEAAVAPKSAPFKLKKVCRPQEVVGSAIPRMICRTKRIYLKDGEESQEKNGTSGDPQSQL